MNALPAQTIDEVIAELETVMIDCIKTNHRAGYFAALYHRVTCRIKTGMEGNEFEDGARMGRLDVLFANRYLEAWKQWRNGQQPTASWAKAFKATENSGIIMQHLLLGINAHINLDLGIATACTMQGLELNGVQQDFNKINAILASLTDEVEQEIFKVSPLLFLVDKWAKNYDEMLVQFSIGTAREGAWIFANELAGKTGVGYDQCIAFRDNAIAELAQAIAEPEGRFFSLLIKIVAFFETKNVAKVIATMQKKK